MQKSKRIAVSNGATKASPEGLALKRGKYYSVKVAVTKSPYIALYNSYGSVVTSTGDSFEREMNKQFPEYNTTMYKYLKNTELIDKVYTSLNNGIPVPFEWAAKFEDEWTLHYSLVIGMDIPGDSVTVLNPYGYKEIISIKEFLNRTSFEAYEGMPLFLKFGFAFEIFEKNTIFIVSSK